MVWNTGSSTSATTREKGMWGLDIHIDIGMNVDISTEMQIGIHIHMDIYSYRGSCNYTHRLI